MSGASRVDLRASVVAAVSGIDLDITVYETRREVVLAQELPAALVWVDQERAERETKDGAVTRRTIVDVVLISETISELEQLCSEVEVSMRTVEASSLREYDFAEPDTTFAENDATQGERHFVSAKLQYDVEYMTEV
jgi:hypothetical protein